jgi:hypothetical protein
MNNDSTNIVQNLASLCAESDPQVVTQTERKLNEMIQQLSQLRENLITKQHEVKIGSNYFKIFLFLLQY